MFQHLQITKRPKQRLLKTITSCSIDEQSKSNQDLERYLIQLSKQNEKLTVVNQYLQQSVRRRDQILEVERKHKKVTPFISPINKKNSQLQFRSSSQRLFNSNSRLANFEDTLKLSQILEFSLPDEDAHFFYENDPIVSYLKTIDEEQFIQLIQEQNLQKLLQIHESIQKLLQFSHELFKAVLKLKQIIRSSQLMNEAVLIDEAINLIVEETQSLIKCDRVSCFVVDEAKGEIWSKAAQGLTEEIRLPIDSGVVGYVASSKESVNILNAYTDKRFNKDFDIKNNYKTHTIMASPILNQKHQCKGVIQCVNKNGGFFTSEDLSYLKIICGLSQVSISNSQNQNQVEYTQNKLRQILEYNFKLNQENEIVEIIKLTDQTLRRIMNVEEARTIVSTSDGIKFMNHNELQVADQFYGLVREAISTSNIQSVLNCSMNLNFDPRMDIDTSMPTVSIPMKDRGCLQVINLKGLNKKQTQTSSQAYISNLELEMLDYVSMILLNKLSFL